MSHHIGTEAQNLQLIIQWKEDWGSRFEEKGIGIQAFKRFEGITTDLVKKKERICIERPTW